MPQPQDTRWTDHEGGSPSVGRWTHVEVRYRDGEIGSGDVGDFDPVCWQHDGSKFDIVAYRKAAR